MLNSVAEESSFAESKAGNCHEVRVGGHTGIRGPW